MRTTLAALAAATALTLSATPAAAQERDREEPRRNPTTTLPRPPQPPSPAAQQALNSSDQPDVLLDVPQLSVEEITLEVNNLDVNIALDARLANLLKLTAGANAHIDNVKLTIKGVHAQATLIVRLDNVRAIIERTLQTLDNNPQIVERLLSTVDTTVGTVGGVANNAVGTVGEVAGSALRSGQLLDLARLGLTEVSRTVNNAGQTVRRVRDSSGRLLEVVTDGSNRILSSRAVSN